MPQLVLEFTDNIASRPDFKALFASLHQLLHETAKAELAACKSRAWEIKDYWIGDGDEKHAFVHLSISLLAGRSQQAKEAIGNSALQLLTDYFQHCYAKHLLQLTVQVNDMPTELYFKSVIEAQA